MERRHCLLALGAADPAAGALLRAALGGGVPSPEPAPPAPAASPFTDLPHELWLPAGPGGGPQGFTVTWVHLPVPWAKTASDPLAHTCFDLALVAAPANPPGVEAGQRLTGIAHCLGATRCVVVWTAGEAGPPDAVHPPEPRRETPGSAAPMQVSEVWLDPARPDSLDAVRPALARALATLPPERPRARARVWVEHLTEGDGATAGIQGVLTDGGLRCGQTLRLLPTGRLGRVKTLQTPEGEAMEAVPGQRLVLTLEWLEHTGTDTQPPAPSPPDSARAGEAEAGGTPPSALVCVAAEVGDASTTLDVQLLEPAGPPAPASVWSWKDRERVRVYLGNTAVPGTLFLHSEKSPAPAGRLAQLRLDQPLPALGGDRLLVCAEADPARCFGARVLDPDGDRKRWQRPEQRALLAARAAAPEDPVAWLSAQLKRDRLVKRDAVLSRTLFPPAAVAEAVATAIRAGQILRAGEWLAEAAWGAEWQRRAAEAVDRFHAAQPHRLGLPLDLLHKWWSAERLAPEGFEAMLRLLSRAGLTVSGVVVHRAGRRPVLIERLAGAVAFVRQRLTERPLAPPARGALAPDAGSAEALQFLLESGEAVEVGPNLVLEAGAYARAVQALKKYLRRRGRATLGELREHLGTTRRVLLPLCEKLEREGVTRREGDYHRLAAPDPNAGRSRPRPRAGRRR